MSQLLRSIYFRNLRYKGGRGHIQFSNVTTPVITSNDDSRLPQDLVMKTLQSSSSSVELLNTVSRHLQLMNHEHLLQVLRSLFQLNKQSRDDEVLQNIRNNPTFGSLCQALKKNARAFEPNDYIEALKTLSSLKIPIDSSIQQTILQLIRSNINNFNIKQIMFIDFLISRYDEKNPLVDALKLALPLVFQIHLPLELDDEDLPLLIQMLNYASVHELPERVINNIITGILMQQSIDYKTAKPVLLALSYININSEMFPTRVKLLHQCFDALCKGMDQLQPQDLIRLVWRFSTRVLEKHMEFSYPPIWDAISDFIVKKNLDFELSLRIGKELVKIGHVHMQMLEHLVNAAHENLDMISKLKPHFVISFIQCLSVGNYKPDPDKWHDIKLQISRNNILQLEQPTLPYCRLAVDLVSLGFYDKQFLSKFFSENFLRRQLERDHDNDYAHIMIVHEAAKLFCDGYDISPPDDVLRRARDKYLLSTGMGSVKDALTRGLGGQEFHIADVQLPCGIVADVLIALDAGKLVAFKQVHTEGVTQLEDLNLPNNVKLLCLMKFNRNCYALNADRLKGFYSLLLDILERQGIATVPLNFNAWINMPSRERLPYLMREINSKLVEAGLPRTTGD